MASVNPYMPCPCGSGQKFKWCCQKVESYAERAQRMVDSGQIEASLKPLEEGLARFPDNAWLLTRKAVVEAHLKRFEPAKATLRSLLEKNPGHVGGTILLTRLLLETEGPDASIAQFQQGLSAMPADRRRELAPLAQFLGVSLNRAGLPIASLKHLELAAQWAGDQDKDRSIARSIATQRAAPQTSVWEKNPVSAPAGAGGGDRRLPRVVRAGDGMGRRGALGVGRLGVRAALRRLVRRRRRRPQPRPVLPVDRRPRGRHRGPAPIHRAHRADDRRGRPRGPLPAPRGRRGRRDRRVRPPDLADPRPRGTAAGAGGQPLPRAGAGAPHPPRRPGLVPDRPLLPARSPADRGPARAVAARHPAVRGRGDRRRGRRRAGDLRRQPARPPGRPVHGRGPLDDPPGASPDQGDRESPAAPAGPELAVEPAQGPLGRGGRTAQPRAAGVTSSARSGPRRRTRP